MPNPLRHLGSEGGEMTPTRNGKLQHLRALVRLGRTDEIVTKQAIEHVVKRLQRMLEHDKQAQEKEIGQ